MDNLTRITNQDAIIYRGGGIVFRNIYKDKNMELVKEKFNKVYFCNKHGELEHYAYEYSGEWPMPKKYKGLPVDVEHRMKFISAPKFEIEIHECENIYDLCLMFISASKTYECKNEEERGMLLSVVSQHFYDIASCLTFSDMNGSEIYHVRIFNNRSMNYLIEQAIFFGARLGLIAATFNGVKIEQTHEIVDKRNTVELF